MLASFKLGAFEWPLAATRNWLNRCVPKHRAWTPSCTSGGRRALHVAPRVYFPVLGRNTKARVMILSRHAKVSRELHLGWDRDRGPSVRIEITFDDIGGTLEHGIDVTVGFSAGYRRGRKGSGYGHN
jgi:hypothetical protein